MLLDASAALRAPNHHEASLFNHSEQEGHKHLSRHQLTLAERIAFSRSYYRALALVTFGRLKIPFESLACLDMLEYLQMREANHAVDPGYGTDRARLTSGINFLHVCHHTK